MVYRAENAPLTQPGAACVQGVSGSKPSAEAALR